MLITHYVNSTESHWEAPNEVGSQSSAEKVYLKSVNVWILNYIFIGFYFPKNQKFVNSRIGAV